MSREMRNGIDKLDDLRTQIDAIDAEIIAAVARRAQVAEEIARAKLGAAELQPIFHRERERRVHDRVASLAAKQGLPDGLARQLVEVLVEASHQAQERVSREGAVQAQAAAPTRWLIIGGNGRMGRCLGGTLASRGHTIDVYDLDDVRALEDAIAAADITMLAVPMQEACRVAGEVAPHVRPDALLCDINSLKQDICRVMGEHCPGEVVGLHPMFGPTVRTLRRQKIVICEVRSGPRAAGLRDELGQLGAELIDASPATHDRMMAIVQVLMHFSTLVMGEALRRTGVAIDESLRFTSPIYRLELAFTGRLFAQNPELYAEIEMSNPYGAEVRQGFVEAAAHLAAIIDAGDRPTFREVFNGAAEHFRDFAGEGMALSDHLIETLVRRP